MVDEILTEEILDEDQELNEDDVYAHKLGKGVPSDWATFELPQEIKLLAQKDVEDFVKELNIEEEFKVGYVTPIYFYGELMRVFSLMKATELVGYTGIDYRQAYVDDKVTPEEKEKRLAMTQKQIEANPNGADGHSLNQSGDQFSANYRDATNKLARNYKSDDKKHDIVYDANGNPVVNAQGYVEVKDSDMNRILFYPKIGSKPKVIYYVDLRDGQGFTKIDRNTLVDVLYKRVKDAAAQKDINWMNSVLNGQEPLSKADIKFIKSLGFDSIEDYLKEYGGLTISEYKKAVLMQIDPHDYRKTFPYSKRWSLGQFTDKVKKVIEQDSATISSVSLDASKGYGRFEPNSEGELNATREDKPQVRALYTNQIYYLSKSNKKLGAELHEGLEKEVSLDEAKRYVKRYYVRPQNIFCSNKEDILQALLRVGDENCSIYSLKNLSDHEDVQELTPNDIIYYYDDHVLYDKNHVQVMDYDLFVKHEEERKKVANVDSISDATFGDMYDDRVTDDDLKDKEAVANFKAINKPSVKEEVENPFDLTFESYNVYGELLTEATDKHFTCCICGEECDGYGNNPAPYREEGKCCDACNRKFVIPARLQANLDNMAGVDEEEE